MKRSFVYSSVVLGLLTASASAVDFKVDGSVQSFSKAGFNNQKLTSTTAPTDSFTTLFSQLNLTADMGYGLKLGLGGSVGGLVYDSTSSVGGGANSVTGSVVQDSYFGMANDKGTVQNYLVHNAFLEYTYDDMLYVKLGRYQSGKVGEWFSGYNQGAEAYVNAGPAKLWGFFSNRRAFAFDQWLNDYYVVHRVDQGTKTGIAQNTYAAGLDVGMGGFTISGFSYFVPDKVVAPGVSLTLDTNPAFEGQGFRSVTKVRTLFPIAQGNYREGKSRNTGRDWGKIQDQTATLYIEQKFDIDNMNFGAGYYQNFGNANALIGTWGNPIMVDFWTATAYEQGRALSDIVGADAVTGFGFFGMTHGSFDWRVIARGTSSKRSDEQSIALHLAYQVNEQLSLGGKLEWLNDTTKAGYHAYSGGALLGNNRTDDRSHAFFFVSQSF